MFSRYSATMDFATLLSQMNEQHQMVADITKRAENGSIGEDEAESIGGEIRKVMSSLKASAAIFFELHKDPKGSQYQTIKDALTKLENDTGRLSRTISLG
ncbi:hypothetical protein [Sulfuricurvum sp.]|uniref:hypothetical protein n=1 Tax=Sulfuricurvum sp. TaxID=2025608 RepID=UPI00261D7677|nr:hypothetical protein [Sulfuricurvum sp.]MDD3598176.1 hypothetical protein [Sulfuricurvum sp.]